MKYKIFGFYDFDVTAEKTKDFFLRNNFDPAEVSIVPVKEGQKFTPILPAAETKLPVSPDHPAIVNFFRRLFKMDGKGDETTFPLEADRSGFILAVITDSEEQKLLAQETLASHGASHIQTIEIAS